MSTKQKTSWRDRLFSGLSRSREKIASQLRDIFSRSQIDDETYNELESILISSDVGVEATTYLIEQLRKIAKKQAINDGAVLKTALAELLQDLIAPIAQELVIDQQPFVIMMVGINGSGKTTSIGKLAKYYQAQGKSVLLAAGDTFRAAAREQLIHWGEKNDVAVIAQDGGDPAAVMFDAVSAAKARKIDILIADTAGRLPTQNNLMDEIARVKRVIQKVDASAPHEILLVLDATIGQNAIAQVLAFDKAIGISGLILTKLDGSAKGGILAAIAKTCPKPIRFIGVGEGIDDLRPFKVEDFVAALLG